MKLGVLLCMETIGNLSTKSIWSSQSSGSSSSLFFCLSSLWKHQPRPRFPNLKHKKQLLNHNKQFNANGPIVSVKEEHDINDSTSKHPHTVIVIRLTDQQTQKYLKTTF